MNRVKFVGLCTIVVINITFHCVFSYVVLVEQESSVASYMAKNHQNEVNYAVETWQQRDELAHMVVLDVVLDEVVVVTASL